MGRCNYYAIGYGMTEREALANAREMDLAESGHQDGYNGGIASSTGENDKSKCLVKPKKPKSCKVDKVVQKGARKWETVFRIEPKWGFSRRSSGENLLDLRSAEVKTTQGDAIKKAKEMALEFNQEFSVSIEKRLVDSDCCIATVTPNKSQMGKWEFTGIAREQILLLTPDQQ